VGSARQFQQHHFRATHGEAGNDVQHAWSSAHATHRWLLNEGIP